MFWLGVSDLLPHAVWRVALNLLWFCGWRLQFTLPFSRKRWRFLLSSDLRFHVYLCGRGVPGSAWCEPMWDLWWTKWLWENVSSGLFVFILWGLFYQHPWSYFTHLSSTWYHCIIWQVIWMKHWKIPCQIQVLSSSPTLWFSVPIWPPFNMNTLAGKGIFSSLLGWRFSQRLCWNSRFKIIFFFFFCDSRCSLASTFVWKVELKMFSSPPDCSVVTLYMST